MAETWVQHSSCLRGEYGGLVGHKKVDDQLVAGFWLRCGDERGALVAGCARV